MHAHGNRAVHQEDQFQRAAETLLLSPLQPCDAALPAGVLPLSKILGHADFDVTSDIYIQADISKLHQEMAKLDPRED